MVARSGDSGGGDGRGGFLFSDAHSTPEEPVFCIPRLYTASTTSTENKKRWSERVKILSWKLA